MATTVVGFSPGAAIAIERTVRQVLGAPHDRTSPRLRYAPHSELRYHGLLLGDLDAPENGFTGPTTALVQICDADTTGDDDQPGAAIAYDATPEQYLADYVPRTFAVREADDQDAIRHVVVIVNRDPSLTISEGTYVKIEWICGEWSPYWVGC